MKNATPQMVRIGFLANRYDINRATIYRWIKKEGFPKPKKLSPSCSAWDLKAVEAWEDSRPELGEVA